MQLNIWKYYISININIWKNLYRSQCSKSNRLHVDIFLIWLRLQKLVSKHAFWNVCGLPFSQLLGATWQCSADEFIRTWEAGPNFSMDRIFILVCLTWRVHHDLRSDHATWVFGVRDWIQPSDLGLIQGMNIKLLASSSRDYGCYVGHFWIIKVEVFKVVYWWAPSLQITY